MTIFVTFLLRFVSALRLPERPKRSLHRPAGNGGYLGGDEGIVETAHKLLGSHADGKHRHVAVGVSATLPADESTLGHGAAGSVGNAAERGVEVGFGLVATGNKLVEAYAGALSDGR